MEKAHQLLQQLLCVRLSSFIKEPYI
jgi:hypothetical protein